MSTPSRQSPPNDDIGIDYVTTTPPGGTTPTTDAAIYFSPAELNQPNPASDPKGNDNMGYVLDEIPKASTSGGNNEIEYVLADPVPGTPSSNVDANPLSSASIDASPQDKSKSGSATIERSTSEAYNLPGTDQTYSLRTSQGGLYDLPGDSGEVYRMSNRRSRHQPKETVGWFNTRHMKATMFGIILIIIASAAVSYTHLTLPTKA